jgi:hypothetical protein
MKAFHHFIRAWEKNEKARFQTTVPGQLRWFRGLQNGIPIYPPWIKCFRFWLRRNHAKRECLRQSSVSVNTRETVTIALGRRKRPYYVEVHRTKTVARQWVISYWRVCMVGNFWLLTCQTCFCPFLTVLSNRWPNKLRRNELGRSTNTGIRYTMHHIKNYQQVCGTIGRTTPVDTSLNRGISFDKNSKGSCKLLLVRKSLKYNYRAHNTKT